MITVDRPVVRSFSQKFVRNAAQYVKRGGHAIVWETPRLAWLVFREPNPDDDGDLGEWAMLDLGRSRWSIVDEGPLRGLARTRVPNEHHDIVKRWIERDSIFPGPKRRSSFDCLSCAACCKDNEVVLQKVDVARFRKAGRMDLTRRPYARIASGKVILTLLRSKDCRHLDSKNRCGIYEIRPDACRMFPVGSECCLFAREEELGVCDGLSAGG